MTQNPIDLLERALQFLRHSLGDRSTGQPNQKRTENYPQNPIGLLETALQISAAKANGCDGGDCSCGERDDCLARGWEEFAPQPPQPQPEQPTQPQKPIL